MTKRVPLLLIFGHGQNAKKRNADRTRTFGPAQRRDTSHYIAMASTNTQDTQGEALSLQDVIFMVNAMG